VEDLSLHVLDIVENSTRAGATRVDIKITEDYERDLLTIEIGDNGAGMDDDMKAKLLDPFFTTKTTRRVGLGLPLLAQAARDTEGELEINTAPGEGTTVRASFKHSHPDRKPLGDMLLTVKTVVLSNPELVLTYEHRDGDEVYRFSTESGNNA
jgi:signal transduction histidine kinase